jgi:hypothetical protein
MELENKKYIIVEIIPTYSTSDKGFIAQISALKLDGIKLLDRFDYRINKDLIENDYVKSMLNYDNDSFTYLDNKEEIKDKFKEWIEELPLLLLDNTYTLDYFKDIENNKELVYDYLDMEYNNEVFNNLLTKYNLEPSDHLVDLVYEAIINESNK